MKKIISVIITLAMLLTIVPTSFAADFSDFNSSHWAYEYVTALVNDGTINGYADGTFRPEGTVTRAEFVKMIGNGPETRKEAFSDVSSSHWAYNYIMTSGLDALKGNFFMPDTPITRGDVAVLLWKRAGSPKGITAPPVVHRQSSNWDAASWVYTNGIMVGDDYIDLRLGDTLTRGEASALIVRSRNVNASTSKTRFMESVDPEIFETVYNAFGLIDRPYDKNATITNGELAMAAARLQSADDVPEYPNVSADRTFEHKFAQPINMLCRYYLGLENDNAVYADKKATTKEAIAALMFAASTSRGSAYIPQSAEAKYPGFSETSNVAYDKLIKNSYGCGIWYNTVDEIDLNKEITMSELACLVLEFNGFAGFHSISVINADGISFVNKKIRTNLKMYPKNHSEYRIILSSVPNYVYDTPFICGSLPTNKTYQLTSTYRFIFTTMLSTWVNSLRSAGYNIELTYYPGIAVDNGNGYSLRVGIKAENVPGNTKISDIITCKNSVDGETILNNGDFIYADIDTGKKIDNIIIGIENMVLSQIIK